MKILAGTLKSYVLNTPLDPKITRPILTRIKKSLFDILMPLFNLQNINFLDLFAGTGTIGIEAISRGAIFSTFVEMDKNMHKSIIKNLTKCKILEKSEVFCQDVFDFFETYIQKKFDIIFAGPPYQKKLCSKTLETLNNSKIFTENTIFIIQHDKREIILEKTNNFIKYRTKKYGNTILDFFQNKKKVKNESFK